MMQSCVIWVLCMFLGGVSWAESIPVNAAPPGELHVELVASAIPDYIAEWVGTPHEHDIYVKPIKVVAPEQTLYAAIVVTGYQVDGQQMTDLVGGWRLIGPGTTVLIDQQAFASHRKQMTHLTGFVMLDPGIDLTLEQGDARGLYTIEATVTDRVSGKTATNSYQVTLTDKAKE